MSNRDSCEKKKAEESKAIHNGKKLTHLLQEIEDLRDELNKKVLQDTKRVNSIETLKLSQKLDELIAKYLMDKE
jgi:hypothetical protein